MTEIPDAGSGDYTGAAHAAVLAAVAHRARLRRLARRRPRGGRGRPRLHRSAHRRPAGIVGGRARPRARQRHGRLGRQLPRRVQAVAPVTAPRRGVSADNGRRERADPDADPRELIRTFAQGLPEALDDEMAARLAARMRPFLTESTSFDQVPADRLLTVADAASRAHVHIETIRRAVRDGRLAIAGRVGRSARIEPLELDRWLAGASDAGGTIRTSSARRVRRPRQTNEYSLKAAFKQSG